jgi:hypothetical protein
MPRHNKGISRLGRIPFEKNPEKIDHSAFPAIADHGIHSFFIGCLEGEPLNFDGKNLPVREIFTSGRG